MGNEELSKEEVAAQGLDEMGKRVEHASVVVGTPEAPASATVRCSIEGFEWLFTLRSFGPEKGAPLTLLKRVKFVNERLVQMGAQPVFGKNAAPGKAAEAKEDKPAEMPCRVHNVMMKRREGKDGSTWYSHTLGKDADGKTIYCNGKEK